MSVLDDLSEEHRALLIESEVPASIEPMLATLTDDRFSHPDWIYERKLDGERCLAWLSDRHVRLRSRTGRDTTPSFPEVADALGDLSAEPAVLDGEVVAFEGARTSFQRLQPRIQVSDAEAARRSGVTVYYYLFDVLYVAGRDVTPLPLRTRKSVLKRLIPFADPIRFTTHRNENGVRFFEDACRKGWEGVIAKDARARYESGRSRAWLKFKCVLRQEVVIGGYTAPKGSRTGFGALLVGYQGSEGLVYAGKVGTGFDEATLADLADRLDAHRRESSPFVDGPSGSEVTFVDPALVAEVGFTEWTAAGRLRHPRFLGLRRDKAPGDVVREST